MHAERVKARKRFAHESICPVSAVLSLGQPKVSAVVAFLPSIKKGLSKQQHRSARIGVLLLAQCTVSRACAEGNNVPKYDSTFYCTALPFATYPLSQNAASKSDKMEATFETAVMQFVKGDYPTAIAQLQSVQVCYVFMCQLLFPQKQCSSCYFCPSYLCSCISCTLSVLSLFFTLNLSTYLVLF